jgi:hypothetical protein
MSEENIVGKCPLCECNIIEKEKLFACSNGSSSYDEENKKWINEGCQYKIFKTSLGRFGKEEITGAEVEELLSNGKVAVDLISKSGNSYVKDIVVDEKYGIKVDFDSHNEKK